MNRKAPVRAVLFDFGGTLYAYDSLLPGDRESLTLLAELAGAKADVETVHRAYRVALRRTFRCHLTRSFFLHRDMFREAAIGMLHELGCPADPEHLDRYREMQWRLHRRDFRLREGARETLAELRRRGLRLGVVSNIDRDQLAHLGTLAELDRHFDWLLSSEEAGSCKPDSRIFAEALRRAGCEPHEALFVGDSLPQDIAGANRVGLRSVLIWHREDRPPPTDGDRPRHVIRRIPDLLDLLG
ncbi:MAG: HAD family hydrolase [Deltaproteobacteria bacterium]|nr:HAD family hydrolase [Deltaproteobacteria bacterium]